MTQQTFPQITPTARTYTPGVQPETLFEAQDGSTTFISFGTRLVNCKLKLTFANIPDFRAAEILTHYRMVRTNDFVYFDRTHGLGGIDNSLLPLIDPGNQDLKYRYARPPQVKSVYPGISTVECEFTGYLFGR